MPVSEFHHRFIPGALSSAPTILALHGTGGDENDLVPLARMIDGDAAILSPRGRVLENGLPRYFRRISEGVFDADDLREQTAALSRFIDMAASRYRFDRNRVAALGYSNGANIAANMLLTVPGPFIAAMLLRPMIPFEPELPVPALSGLPVLMSAGRRDPTVPRGRSERLQQVLTEAGAAVTMLWRESGHLLSPGELEDVAEWWRRTVAGLG
jgi:phospholipase/carboxylesterase